MTYSVNEWARKSVHLASSLIPLIYYFGFEDRWSALAVLGSLTLIILTAESLRMVVPVCHRLYLQWFSAIIRPREQAARFTGASFVFIGASLTVILFPKPIAVAALLFLAIGDPAACLVGRAWGRIRIFNAKTLEGSAAFLVSAILVTSWIPDIPLPVKIGGALAACLVELAAFRIDDNLTIPLVSAAVMVALNGWM